MDNVGGQRKASLKRYALFAGEFFAGRGWHDLVSYHDDREEAIKEGERLLSLNPDNAEENDEFADWYQVVDLTVGEIVQERDNQGEQDA